ncbi:MAG: PilN domain-containing protein [Propionivibrio sp.]
MKRVSVDFSGDRERLALRIGILLFVLAVEVASWVGWQVIATRNVLTQQTAKLDIQRSRRRSQSPQTPPPSRSQIGELKMAQAVIDRLTTPWESLFSALDSAFDEQVTLIGVEPQSERQEIQLTGEAKNLAAMQGYVRNLEHSPTFADTYLASHQITPQDPQHPVRFVVRARWHEPLTTAVRTGQTPIHEIPGEPSSTEKQSASLPESDAPMVQDPAAADADSHMSMTKDHP